ncbi:MAG: hypothetical protein H0U59_01500 [Gemmatimonadaceae bacterium]|nr:hypothetical protein [Gemmatimonadaceae bacterium]
MSAGEWGQMATVVGFGLALAYIVWAAVATRQEEDRREQEICRYAKRLGIHIDTDAQDFEDCLPESITQHIERARWDETVKAAAGRPRLSTNRNLGIARPGTRNISAAEDK